MEEKEIFVTKPSLPPLEEYIGYLEKIWDKGVLTNFGPLHMEFMAQLTKLTETQFCFPTVNGHSALRYGLQGLGLTGEVITTPFTFASTTHAIVQNGLTPVFCDVKERDCTIDTDKIESLITDKTSAILAVHVYGMPCDVYEIERIAKKHNLKVIYDGAHAFGEKINGKSIMSFGDLSMMSFHATKAFNTIEGGALAFNDLELGKRLFKLGNFGIMGEEEVSYVGGNAKMNEFQAAMGLCNLNHFAEAIAKRKAVYDTYTKLLGNIEGIVLLKSAFEDFKCNYTYFPIFINKEVLGFDRDYLYEKLLEHGIHSRKYFYPITCDYDCYLDCGYIADVPVARGKSTQVLTLPNYESLSLIDVERICNYILDEVNK